MSAEADPENALKKEIARRLGALARRAGEPLVARRSIDARQRPVKLIYSVDIDIEADRVSDIPGAVRPPEKVSWQTAPGTGHLSAPPVVVGAGPAGLFSALLLAEHGYRPVLLERGGDVSTRRQALRRFSETRLPDPECNALFGLGGAGTFSDGKLRTGLSHPWLMGVLETLAGCGAPRSICVDAKPHIGTDVLVRVVENLAARIRKAGGVIRTEVRFDGIRSRDGRVVGIATSEGDIDCGALVLAIGHSARDTWQRLAENGVALEPKPFQLGVRVEHEQAWLDRVRYGDAAGHPALGAADYKLAARVDGVPVFSFCMCPGGETMPTVNEPGHLAINGMSRSRRDSPFSSSGLVVTLSPEIYGGRDLISCLAFQRNVERRCFEAGGGDYRAPAQRLVDFRAGAATRGLPATSYPLGVTPARLDALLPPFVATPLRRALDPFDRRIRGYLHPGAVALAPESRASSPLRIVRHPETLETPAVAGVYPVGEGAGYAGGIMSSALDGLNAARRIIERFALPA